jgi:hypothetical protein
VAESGGQPGNQNAAKNKAWRSALDRAIAQDDGKRLRAAAEKLLDLAEAGEAWAVKELGDRLDGKAAQAIINADGENFRVEQIQRVIVDAAKD